MHSALACLLFAAALGQDLEIANPRATYGYLGATHPVVEGRLPGDTVFFTFDLKNLKLDDTGRAMYSMFVEVLDERNRPLFKLGPTNSVAQNYLGGNSMPVSAHLEIPVESEPGAFLFRVTVTDRATSKNAVFQRKGKILPPAFGIVQVATYADRDSKVPVAPVNVIGASLFVHFAAVGFARDKKSDDPDIEVSMRVLDDKGQPTFAKNLTGSVNKNVPADHKIIPMQFAVTLNRTGDFTIELEAHDKLAGKKVKSTLPLRVVTAP